MTDETKLLLPKGPATTNNARLFLAVFSAVLGNFSFGFSLVYPSPVIPHLKDIENPRLRMNTYQAAWFGSIFTLGAAAGGLGTMLLNDKVGRKLSIMLSAVPSTLGYLLMGSAQVVWMLHLGRFLTGIAGGITAASIPVYVSEISHPAVRGILGSCPQITAVCGSLALYALGLILPWRWLAVAGEVPALIMLVLLCFMPRSPRYLIACGREEEACKALSWLRGPGSDTTAELNRIQQSIASQGRITWSELALPFYYKPILISVGMRFLQQMTGITPILVYLEPIFHKTSISLAPKYDAALVGAVRLLSVITAASLMDKAGRRALLFTSGFLMFLSTLSMTMYTHTRPCPIYNITTHSTLSLQTTSFDPITIIPLISTMEAFGLFVPFLFFCVVCVINIIFTGVCVPETRGRSLEEIENYFRTGRTFTIRDT
ncbi:hypothetical protein JZ751_001264 [Albula glossodonta]|uniref:Major facilitator superfamily (MFS) profile domain-containing protein n=1 Tax=Albula glossodonta TaxID=121402 RepID=A0A8T2PT04_9TELE|nr:hypothetical protein JZ751_001264 [Albula glossodonta]